MGLSVVNWIVKWEQEVNSIDQIFLKTSNPLMVNIMEAIAEVYNPTYNHCRKLESEGVGPLNRRMYLLYDMEGGFYVGEKASADSFKNTNCIVSINSETVVSSNWDLLTEGTPLDRLNVLLDWTIILDGKEVGQVKRFNGFVPLLGVVRPIRIYINTDGEIVRY